MKGLPVGAPLVCVALGCLLTLLLQRSFHIQFDEGYTLNAAWQMWHGMRMYDDFRLYVGPGSGYAVYWLWRLIGDPSFLAARVLSLLLSFSSIAAVYLILARRGIRGAALALALSGWVIASAQYVLLNHNSISAYAASWMLLAFLRAQARDREGTGKLADHFVVGALGGIVLLFLQTKGLALIGATAAFTLFAAGGKRGLRAAAAIVVGAAVAVGPLFLRWRPSQLIREWFIEPMAGDYLGHTSASGAFAIGCLLFAVGMVALALRLRDRLLVAVAVFQLALFVSFLNNLELLHVAGNSFPLFVFVPMALQRRPAGARAATTPPREKFSAAAVTAIVVGVIAALLATPMGRPLFEKSTLYVDFIRREPRNVIPRPRVAAAHAVYAGPVMPGLYYEIGKKNPYAVSHTLVCNGDCRNRLLAQITEIKPEIALLAYRVARPFAYDENNVIDAYFRERYVMCPVSDPEGLIVRAIDASWCP